MPRYDYRCEVCGYEKEAIHSIVSCNEKRICVCGGTLIRRINGPHVEGSLMYPFKLWNLKLPDGQFSVEIRSKTEHKEVLRKHKSESPAITNWGKRRTV